MQKQLGEDTDTLKVGERLYRDRHHSHMKPRFPEPRGNNFQFNYAELEVDEDNQSTEEHEYNASKIVGYRPAGMCLGDTGSGRNRKDLDKQDSAHTTTHPAGAPENRSQVAQDTAHATQHTERAPRCTGAKWPRTPHTQNNTAKQAHR